MPGIVLGVKAMKPCVCFVAPCRKRKDKPKPP